MSLLVSDVDVEEFMKQFLIFLAIMHALFKFWMLNFGWTTYHEITLVNLSVPLSISLSVHPSLNFIKIGSLVFSNIVNDESWPWYLVTEKARILKKHLVAQIGPNGPKLGPNWGFLSFPWVWIIIFPWYCIP